MAPRAGTKTASEPRGPRHDTVETIFTAAFRILIHEGAHALTPQRLHKETGVARTTIYRNWPDTAALIDTMLAKATGNQDMPDFTGALDHDLRAAVRGLVFRFNHRPLRPLFGALVEHGRHGSETDIAADYIHGVLRPVVRALREGMERGDIAEGDTEALAIELCGPLLTRHVLLGQVVTEVAADTAVDEYLASLT